MECPFMIREDLKVPIVYSMFSAICSDKKDSRSWPDSRDPVPVHTSMNRMVERSDLMGEVG
jgi:hypothetical protein